IEWHGFLADACVWVEAAVSALRVSGGCHDRPLPRWLLLDRRRRAMPRNSALSVRTAEGSIGARVGALDWSALSADLDRYGCAVTGPLLSAGECAALAASYPQDGLFRSRVIMARHGFGRGEYKYFS